MRLIFVFIRFLIVSDGLSNKLLKNSLSQSKQERTWIHPGKNRFTKLLHDWMITFQNILNLKLSWNSWNKTLANYRLEKDYYLEKIILLF